MLRVLDQNLNLCNLIASLAPAAPCVVKISHQASKSPRRHASDTTKITTQVRLVREATLVRDL